MNKRTCPFDEDLSPQLKVYVDPNKAVDGYIKEKELKEIYERTMQLLKSGSKNLQSNVNTVHKCKKNHGYHFESPRLKQMIMNDKLELEISKKIIVIFDKQMCSKCSELITTNRSCCFHCIDSYCTKCLSECSKCSEQFCPKCILTTYEGGEHEICLECYR